ncbi:uncharacterized protein C8orf48-like [Colossoma macropomum]|uniref:uncharacterized protein C8orf48-like n=1 Tax=Colossoma macropomum TaxID=42526 RepID=UPI001864D45E|nr:uncharacterized protein C8orf48-like [Colossoma macropomum]
MTGTKGQEMDEAVALKAYCKRRLKHIKQQKHLLECKEKHQKRKCTSIKPVEPISDQSVPVRFIFTLKLKTFREEMKKGAEQDFHEPSRCRACLAEQADLAMNYFIRKKKNQLQAQLLEERIQSHLYNKDTGCLLGEILKDLPKPSDDPSEIWQRLLSTERLHETK